MSLAPRAATARGPGRLVREARIDAGLTQVELASRIGSTQSAVARLESSGSAPRLQTLQRALAATGHELLLGAEIASAPDVDESLILANLRLTPGERLDAFSASYEQVRRLVSDVRAT